MEYNNESPIEDENKKKDSEILKNTVITLTVVGIIAILVILIATGHIWQAIEFVLRLL